MIDAIELSQSDHMMRLKAMKKATGIHSSADTDTVDEDNEARLQRSISIWRMSVVQSGWLLWTFVHALVHSVWVICLLLCQLYQVSKRQDTDDTIRHL